MTYSSAQPGSGPRLSFFTLSSSLLSAFKTVCEGQKWVKFLRVPVVE
jgi:hypothetical protein